MPINLLTELHLEELSLVDRPANPMAIAPIFKADTSIGEDMDKDTIKNLEADVAKFKSENERLRKALIDNGFVIEADKVEKKAPVETIEVDGEQIYKADIPAAILKKMEADAEAIAKAELEKADAALTKKVQDELPNWKEDVVKAILKSIDGSEKFDAIMEALKAADKAFDAKMEELGKTDVDGDMGSAEVKLENLTKAYKASHNVTKEQAYAEVVKTEEGRKLIADIYKAKKE